MIIKDPRTEEILVKSEMRNVLIDQNGNHWLLTDDIEGLTLELWQPSPWSAIATISMGERSVMIKPVTLPAQAASRR